MPKLSLSKNSKSFQFKKSINVIHHSIRLKEKWYKIFYLMQKNTLDKI